LIKTPIPPTFLLEWFLKSLHPPISKDVATSRVSNQEESFFKAQHLDLIYAQPGMLYHLLPEAPWSIYDPRKKLKPHVDGIIGSTNVKSADSTTKSAGGPASSGSSKPTQSRDVHSVQSSKNPNGDQQPDGNKRKVQTSRKGGKNGNKPKEKDNNGKQNDNVGEEKKEKRKVKFPCKLCTDGHLTHLCPKLMDAMMLFNLLPAVMMNSFSHNQHLASSFANTGNVAGGSQNPPLQDGDHVCINTVDEKIDIATRSLDYGSLQANTGLEDPPPPPETDL
jgi:hypothetical protein